MTDIEEVSEPAVSSNLRSDFLPLGLGEVCVFREATAADRMPSQPFTVRV